MTYETFREKIKEMGFVIEEDDCYEVLVATENSIEYTVLRVLKSCKYVIDTDYASFKELDQVTRGKLYTLASTLACTPIEDRKGKYLLKIDGVIEATAYLNYSRDLEMYKFDTKNDSPRTKSEFTREEIATLPLDLRELVDRGILRKIKI